MAADPFASAVQVLEQYISGEVGEANALSQLLHLHSTDDKTIAAALAEKTNTVVANADAGAAAAAQAGAKLVAVAKHIDAHAGEAEAAPAGDRRTSKAATAKAAAKAAAAKAPSRGLARQLLDHTLILCGGPHRAAKETAIRAQGCSLVASLVSAAPGHQKAVEKLLEFATDKVPSIRQRAVLGLGAVTNTLAVEQALSLRSNDPFMAVRMSAVRSLRVTVGAVPALSRRVDDVEACVRAELFKTLAREPAGGKHFGPAAFSRLCAGLTDRASVVRTAAGQAVDAWHRQFGGVLAILARCDLHGDDALLDAVAGALAARYKDEALAAVKATLSGQVAASPDGVEQLCTVLLARHAITQMPEADRDDLVDVPQLLQRTNEALGTAGIKAHGAVVLRQLLLVVAAADFCDEACRRRAERLAEAVLQRAPLSSASPLVSNGLTIPDLGVLIMRKCAGLGRGFQPRSAKIQALEAQCSVRGVLLVSDLCQPLQGAAETQGSGSGDEGEGQFATRLSNRLQDLNDAIEEHTQKRTELAAAKKHAIANEEFIQAQRIKEQTKKNDAALAQLEKEHVALKAERDNILLRVLGILRALLKWSGSDLSKDPALFGTLERIMRPVVSLPALSEDVEIAALMAMCSLCLRHAGTAQNHWSLFLELMRQARPENQPEGLTAKQKSHFKMRAAVAAVAMADCSLVHIGAFDGLDRDEAMSAAHALGAIPFYARHVAVEPLCRWLMGLGHVFFEEHLREPVLEVQWALGWMLVEAFKQTASLADEGEEEEQKPPRAVATPATASHAAAANKVARARGTSWVQRPTSEPQPEAEKPAEEEEDEDPAVVMATASKLMQFFALLPKMPGKHAGPMLSLAVESIAETGLWRRAVLLPHMAGSGLNKMPRWKRGFSWPQLFGFAHDRLAADMRFRLWRCALQLCISDPALATYAEVPFALVQVMKDAPAGAAGLVREAVTLGADPSALSPLVSRLPPGEQGKDATGVLLSREAAQAAERERRAKLAELGINCDAWAPAHIETPDIVPPHHRIKLAKGDASLKGVGPGLKKRGAEPIVPPSMMQVPAAAPAAVPAPEAAKAEAAGAVKRRRVAGKSKDLSLPLANADVD